MSFETVIAAVVCVSVDVDMIFVSCAYVVLSRISHAACWHLLGMTFATGEVRLSLVSSKRLAGACFFVSVDWSHTFCVQLSNAQQTKLNSG